LRHFGAILTVKSVKRVARVVYMSATAASTAYPVRRDEILVLEVDEGHSW
jgi:hypothetical protein